MTTSTPPIDQLAIPLRGPAGVAVRLRFGGGELRLHPAPPGMLVVGSFEGGVVHRWKSEGRLELEPLSPGRPFVTWRPTRWDVGLTAQVPLDLSLETGANRSTIDLTPLHIGRLELRTGASETEVWLPSRGQSTVRVSCGLASVVLHAPPSASVRIRGTMALGSTSVDERRFPRWGGGWSSPDYETAAHRMDIHIEGGLGAVKID